MSGRFSTFLSTFFSVVVIMVALGATAFAQPVTTRPVPAKPQPRSGVSRSIITPSKVTPPSVILIPLDPLRADHVGCYGAQTVKTPTLDALARDGVVFERAVSQVPLTWPSHAVILTGTYPFQNGVQDFTGQPLAQQFRTVSQAFQQAGYATGAVVSAFVLDRSWGLARGFDFYDDAFSAETFETKDAGLVDRRAGESVAHAIAWLKRTPRRPFFLWLHLYDPHSPYDPPEPYRTEYRSHLYDGEIAYADHELGNLVSWLRQNHLYDSSLIVALSDHGESLGEHVEDEHGFFAYNNTIPGNTQNHAPRNPATVARLREKLQTILAHNPFTRQDASAGNLSPDALEKLRALGYFGFRAAVSPESVKQGLADPKDKLWEFNSILKAEDAFQRKQDDQAEALLTEVQQKDPQIYVIPFLLGESALRRQNWERAADQLQRCLALNPNFDNAMTGLARGLAKLGRVDEAKNWLNKALQSNPQNYRAWYQSGLLDAGSNPPAALSAFEKTIAIQPNFSAGH